MSSIKDIVRAVIGKDSKKQKSAQESETEEKIGEIALNAGEHGTIFGFNRNIIVGTGIAIFAITAIATIFALDNDMTDGSQKPTQRKQQASTAQDGKHETAKLAGNYEEMMREANAQYSGQGRGSGTPPSARQQEPPPLHPVPPVAQTPVSVPAPTQLVPSTSAEDKEEIAYMQRMQSAISFSISDKDMRQNTSPQQEAAVSSGTLESNIDKLQNGQNDASSLGKMNRSLSQALYTAPGKYMLQAGTMIPAALCTGINSDIGGQVVAQVQQDMYDSATGRNLLIPAGSKILGTYRTGSPNNSGRVEITFSSIILPDGGTYAVQGALVAIDDAGYSGVEGKVNRHTGSTLSAGMYSSALAALGSMAAGNTSRTSDTYSAGQLAMQGAMANVMTAASQLFKQGTRRQITVTAAPGTMFNIYVTQGITLHRGHTK